MKATSPTCSAVVPLTSSIPASGEVTVAPSAARAAASSPARGERTRTAPPATESMTCWTGPAMMRPRPITRSWSCLLYTSDAADE